MDAFIGEIRPFAGPRLPNGWAYCIGQTINIKDNQALFALIGTTYGGDGVRTFALPNLSGRVPIGAGQRTGASAYAFGVAGGVDAVALTPTQVPAHTHVLNAIKTPATENVPSSSHLIAATVPEVHPYNDMAQAGTGDALFSAAAIGVAGSGETHENVMPCLVISYIICLDGLFPPPA